MFKALKFSILTFLLLLILNAATCIRAKQVAIKTSEELEKELENPSTTNGSTYLMLDSSVEYKLLSGDITYLINMTITITSSDNSSANISCIDGPGFYPTREIAFVSSNVTLERISFKNCGREIISTFNTSSPFYYSSTHAAALVFLHSRVKLMQVVMNSSYGFSVLGVNLINSVICSVKVFQTHQSINYAKSLQKLIIGSGLLLHYMDSIVQAPFTGIAVVSMIDVILSDNVNFISKRICTREEYTNLLPTSHVPAPNAAALTIMYTQQSYSAKITINRGMFIHNIDQFIGIEKGHTAALCKNNRNGTLCGLCHNQSVIFGSFRCETCSNWWLLTIILYAAIGPLFVFILYALKLTLTAGTINGLIFYAQAANAGILEYIKVSYYGSNSMINRTFQLCFFFLSSMNLNLGFPLCFYNGMNQLWKTGFSLIFPVYPTHISCFHHHYQSLFNMAIKQNITLISTSTGYCSAPLLL